MDGDLDAMIDNGLPIRRYREMLMWNGFTFLTASAAANKDTLNLNDTSMVPWNRKGGLKEVFNNRVPASDIILKAHSARSVLGEGQPGKEPALTMGASHEADKDLFEEAADALAENYEDMTPNEKTEYLNKRSLEKLGGKVEAIPAPPLAKPALTDIPEPPDVRQARRNIPGSENAKPAEESKTVRELVVEEKGRELKEMSNGTQHVLAIVTPILALAQKSTLVTVAAVIGAVLVVAWLIGNVREKKGKIGKAEGRAEATQPKL